MPVAAKALIFFKIVPGLFYHNFGSEIYLAGTHFVGNAPIFLDTLNCQVIKAFLISRSFWVAKFSLGIGLFFVGDCFES